MMARWPLVVLLALILGARASPSSCYNPTPIIGILTQPTEGVLRQYGSEKLQAGYVKWVESSGLRAVPIMYNSTAEEITQLFNSVNGILFMGGPTDIITQPNAYFQAADLLFNLTLEANTRGDYMPLWGTCLGFELLAIIVSRNFNIMGKTKFLSENMSLPLDFTSAASKSRMFGSAPKEIFELFANHNVTDNEHHNAVTPDDFVENPSLPAFFNVLSTNKDARGRVFISTIESKEFPVYGVQWHPERPQFEWHRYQNVNHNLSAVQCSQYVGRFLAGEAHKNCHHFSTLDEEESHLIYNFVPTYTIQVTNGSYEQIYFFGEPEKTNSKFEH